MGNFEMHAFTVTPPYVSASEPNLCDPRDAPWFMIGMPHMDGQGLSVSWFMREAGHLHWWSVAEHTGFHPNTLKDSNGHRALPGVVACIVTGRADVFQEDDVVELRQVQRPSALNGWRSVTELRATTGAVLSVELVTVFAARGGASNHSLETAVMPGDLMAERGTMTSRRTDQIRQMGSVDRRMAEADMLPPVLSVRISSHLHFNGVGLLCFANLHDVFVTAEAGAMPEATAGQMVSERCIHYFGNLDNGDMLDVCLRCDKRPIEGDMQLVLTSHAKRRADGLVVAVCESVYRR
jgi:probable biosynthetic protein (TIGR04098 family)